MNTPIKIPTMRQEYEAYRDACYKGELPQEQASHIHRAFMAGAYSIFILMSARITLLDEVEAEKALRAFQKELENTLKDHCQSLRGN